MIHVIQEGDYSRPGLNFYWSRGPVVRLLVGKHQWRFRIRNPKYGFMFIFNHWVNGQQ